MVVSVPVNSSTLGGIVKGVPVGISIGVPVDSA